MNVWQVATHVADGVAEAVVLVRCQRGIGAVDKLC